MVFLMQKPKGEVVQQTELQACMTATVCHYQGNTYGGSCPANLKGCHEFNGNCECMCAYPANLDLAGADTVECGGVNRVKHEQIREQACVFTGIGQGAANDAANLAYLQNYDNSQSTWKDAPTWIADVCNNPTLCAGCDETCFAGDRADCRKCQTTSDCSSGEICYFKQCIATRTETCENHLCDIGG